MDLEKLNKEDRKHAELMWQLMRNEAMLATILEQLINSGNNPETDGKNTTQFFQDYIEKKKSNMGSIIERLTE